MKSPAIPFLPTDMPTLFPTMPDDDIKADKRKESFRIGLRAEGNAQPQADESAMDEKKSKSHY